MSDAENEQYSDPDERGDEPVQSEGGEDSKQSEAGDESSPSEDGGESVEELRKAVDEKYDFENFGPADMADMSAEEWEVAFDPDTWITGEELIDRVEADLRTRVQSREVFARIERYDVPPRLLAYSDSSYAMVYPDGSVDGEGTVVRDVKPTVALCSMESYDVPDSPDGPLLPQPDEVPESGTELGNNMLQVIAGIQVLAGLVLLGGTLFSFGTRASNTLLLAIAGLGFLTVGTILFVVVANARLSDSFRTEEYRERLRGIGLEDGQRPEFLPPAPDDEGPSEQAEETRSERA